MTLEEKQQQVHELSGIDLDVIKTWDYRKLDLFHFSLLETEENDTLPEGDENPLDETFENPIGQVDDLIAGLHK